MLRHYCSVTPIKGPGTVPRGMFFKMCFYSLRFSDFLLPRSQSSNGDLPLAFFAHGSWVAGKCVNDENLREIHRDNVNCEKCTCNDLK